MSPGPKAEGMGRREARPSNAAPLARRRAPLRGRARLAAPHRGICRRPARWRTRHQLRAAFPGTGISADPSSEAPRRAPIVAPERGPEPPECEVTSLARRDRIPPRSHDVS